MKYFFSLLICLFLLSCSNENHVSITTEYGTMKVQLFDSTPKHKENFKKLVKEGFYNDLLFHRVIKGFMIQGGDPESRGAALDKPLGSGGPGYTIPAEIGTPHFKGMLSAARLGNEVNPSKESSGSQFFIVHGGPVTDADLDAMEHAKGIKYSPSQREKYKKLGGTPMLDGDYTVFGEVISGLDVIDKIADVPKDSRDRPTSDVKMSIK
ncbi:MAG: peptidylprolyl isomerase [Saprospiraceae bacterium]|nr:peptidylprolyl isomerase [Saprospiraceae bacterium]MBL0101965.1 peptidylprolyl isomerase [Saprospiraceae bacterium]